MTETGDERTLRNYLHYLEIGGVTIRLFKKGSRFRTMEKPARIYLNNPNQVYAISGMGKENVENIRETFFLNLLSVLHSVTASEEGGFLIDDRYTFEIGGKNKGYSQIRNIPESFLAFDNVDYGSGNRIPLWLFGFLYPVQWHVPWDRTTLVTRVTGLDHSLSSHKALFHRFVE